MRFALMMTRALMGVLLTAMLTGCLPKELGEVKAPPIVVTVAQPLTREVTDYNQFEGNIAAQSTVEIRARVNGHLVKVAFEDGTKVKAGQLLYEIDSRPYKASLDAALAQKASADADLDLAKKEYLRTANLLRTGASSKEELDVWTAKQLTATAAGKKAQAEIDRAKLDLEFTSIKAPMDGKIGKTLVNAGNLINVGQGDSLLTTLVSTNPMFAYFSIDERTYLDFLRRASREKEGKKELKELRIPVGLLLDGDTQPSHQGLLDFGDNKVNPTTGTILARATIPNDKNLLQPGMRARVRIASTDPYKALLVNEKILQSDQGIRYLFVVNDTGMVEKRDVKLGTVQENGTVVVAEGLKEGEWVVVSGIQRVRDGIKVEAKKHAVNTESKR